MRSETHPAFVQESREMRAKTVGSRSKGGALDCRTLPTGTASSATVNPAEASPRPPFGFPSRRWRSWGPLRRSWGPADGPTSAYVHAGLRTVPAL